jgi:hypothetical protein
LAIAINVCQGSTTRADQVALIFGRLYKHYTDIDTALELLPGSSTSTVRAILKSLETRWAKIDLSFFVVAITLNPFVKRRLFNPNLSNLQLITLMEEVYCRVFETNEVPGNFGMRALAYLTSIYDVFGYPSGDWTHNNLCKRIPVSTCISERASKTIL